MKIVVLTPVFNDWDSFLTLRTNIITQYQNEHAISIVVVNDCSTIPAPPEIQDSNTLIVNLKTNVGHQRAISIGLNYIENNLNNCDLIAVMDSDGEDKPEDIQVLLNQFVENQQSKIIFAGRKKRSESLTFKLSYFFYKKIFKFLTGKTIRFGNFSVIPAHLLNRINHNPDFWNHYSGAIMKANLPYTIVDTNRGTRYAGQSKMNINSLILHGLSAFSLYLDNILIKFLKIGGILGLLLIIAIAMLLGIKFGTNTAIPGWTSSVLIGFLNLFSTVILFLFFIILQHLNSRNKKIEAPSEFYSNYILNTQK